MPTHAEIIATVDKMETERHELHDRMDKDFDRYNLVKYAGEDDEDGEPILDGYKKFTSNDPRTSMNLGLHLLNLAPVLIRVRKPRAQKAERELNNSKELWALGMLSAIDNRRVDLMMPELQDALNAQSMMRGRTAQRVLLIKEEVDPKEDAEIMRATASVDDSDVSDEDKAAVRKIILDQPPETRTFVDVQDWDPRNTYFGLDKNGLSWACHKVRKTAEEIEAEWDVEIEHTGPSHDELEHPVYDYFDETDNIVLMEKEQELKKPTPHGMGGVPVDIHIVGGLPFFQAEGYDYEVNYGESFYQSDREIYDQQNFILSVLAEISLRSIKQGLLVYSSDGQMVLASDPRVSGAETSLRTGSEDVKPLPPMEMVQSSAVFMGVISQMAQRGGFSSAAFGELAFQLSGFAITQLRQGMELPITPSVKTVRIAIKGILKILEKGYTSGFFDVMTLSGRMQDVGRTDFEEEISGDDVAAGGQIDVEIVPQLPQDDQTKAALAQMYVQGDIPLADHRFVRENILQIQDVDQVERAVQEQLAKTGSPSAMAFSNMLAAAEQGDMELASIWHNEFQLQMTERLVQMFTLQSAASQVGAPQGGGGNGRSNSRPAPSALPPALQGIPPPTPTPQAGPIAAPGTPRLSTQSAGLLA